ncbi:unnamed protein product [Symbiodinium sp. CCMP2592]|nr:unnamed protein product [Symbiodinium sp. CCMP2592]
MVYSCGRRLHSASETWDLENYYLLYRSAYNKLAEEALEYSATRWPVRPKCHYFEHLVFDMRGLDDRAFNARFFSNYQCEDWVRRCKQLAVRSHQAHLSGHVVLKYILQFALQWR